MVSIDAVTFDLSDCTLFDHSEHLRDWRSSAGVTHTLRLVAGAPPWTFDLTDVNACAAFFGSQCASLGGKTLSIDVTTAGGFEALRGVFKYRAPKPYDLGMAYVGILWIPFSDCYFQLNIESLERGTTGTRESMVTIMQSQSGDWPGSPDDELYDRAFPSHPLTEVRGRLHEVVRTLTFAASAEALEPFRR